MRLFLRTNRLILRTGGLLALCASSATRQLVLSCEWMTRSSLSWSLLGGSSDQIHRPCSSPIAHHPYQVSRLTFVWDAVFIQEVHFALSIDFPEFKSAWRSSLIKEVIVHQKCAIVAVAASHNSARDRRPAQLGLLS